MRLRWIYKWNSVAVDVKKNKIYIKWSNPVNDDESPDAFHTVVIPVSNVGKEIAEQKRKLLKDIPEIEREILRTLKDKI